MTRFDPHLGLLLERAGRVVGERLDRAFGRDGVTADHWRVLCVLADGEGHTMGEIADPEDSRRVLVYATDGGLELLSELQGKVDRHHAALQALLGDRNARQLERLLTTLIEEAERPTA
jgi:DNA-binding MarR family transcriptional regulator